MSGSLAGSKHPGIGGWLGEQDQLTFDQAEQYTDLYPLVLPYTRQVLELGASGLLILVGIFST